MKGPMSHKITQPNEFCAILDKDGDVVDTVSINDDMIWSMVRNHDKDDPDDSPHTPWIWDGKSWREWK